MAGIAYEYSKDNTTKSNLIPHVLVQGREAHETAVQGSLFKQVLRGTMTGLPVDKVYNGKPKHGLNLHINDKLYIPSSLFRVNRVF